MRPSIVKRKLGSDESVLVVKICFTDPNLVELAGRMGFDCAWICLEHRALDPSVLDSMLRAGRAGNIDCIIRLGPSALDEIPPLLEAGATGLMIPHVSSAERARQVVEHAKFPPLGNRGLETINADADFGLLPLDQYLKSANDETFIVAQIEDTEAVERVDEIAAVKGLDVLFVGPADLSLSLGLPGQMTHPRVFEAVQRVARACRQNGIACGTSGINPDYTRKLFDAGVRYFTGASDYRGVVSGFREAQQTYAPFGCRFEH
ncbi:MAG: aldolase [Phycisphaerae bacterium]|nr:aldolase [Phycisphaerae bacterium]